MDNFRVLQRTFNIFSFSLLQPHDRQWQTCSSDSSVVGSFFSDPTKKKKKNSFCDPGFLFVYKTRLAGFLRISEDVFFSLFFFSFFYLVSNLGDLRISPVLLFALRYCCHKMFITIRFPVVVILSVNFGNWIFRKSHAMDNHAVINHRFIEARHFRLNGGIVVPGPSNLCKSITAKYIIPIISVSR